MTFHFRRSPLVPAILAFAFSLGFYNCEPFSGATRADDYKPYIAGKSKEAELAITGFQVPKGMQTTLVAAEPLLANPVAFWIDRRGRFYVCETFRQQKGVEDNRGHMSWLHDDLAAQSVEDRLKYFRKHLKDRVQSYTKEQDRIRLLWDSDKDGRLDKAKVFAGGFNGIVEGTGAGVLSYNGDVFYTNIPKLWRLRDKNGDGVADERTALHDGFGVRVAFRGHDMHGLTIGPDGRLYFSIGDRGYNVVTKDGRRLKRPDTGAVFRCELDGSNLEVFAYGLRNPQELAFDDYGNLFTGDNNSDSGDKARWVCVMQGSDSGWRMYYQYLKDRGPWNREMIWYPKDSPPLAKGGPGGVPAGTVAAKVQPAYIVPPVANIADGPSGFAYYPGVGLPDRYKGHFFLADFRGNSGRSGIRSFAVKPKGAGFELVDSHQFVWKILATDVDFGYDGALYVTDWVSGWNGPGKGRIYRFAFPDEAKKAAMVKTAELVRTGFASRSSEELVKLLEHPDRRVRQEAQFALVKKNDAITQFSSVIRDPNRSLVSRLHAVWGLGQVLRNGNARAGNALSGKLYGDKPDEILAQAARTFGDSIDPSKKEGQHCLQAGGRGRLQRLLLHKNPRVRSFAAIALGRLGTASSVPKLLDVLKENDDKDPVLRHAAVMGLTGIGRRNFDKLAEAASHPHKSVRLGVLLAMRRVVWERQRTMEDDPGLANSGRLNAAMRVFSRFFDDTEPAIALEAARALDELNSEVPMSALAKLADRPGLNGAMLRRVLNANFRGGNADDAKRVAAIAADADVSENLRLEALFELQNWNSPPPLDRVTGKWRPITNRKKLDVAPIIRPHLGGIFAGSNRVRQAGAKLAAAYGIKEVGPLLFSLFREIKRQADVRVEALRALGALKDERLGNATELALKDKQPLVRAEGRALLAKRDPAKAIPMLNAAIRNGEVVEQQSAIATLATLRSPAADDVLLQWMRQLAARKVAPEIQLDLILAAKARSTFALRKALTEYEKTRPKNDPLARFRESLAGGNADRGREIFFGRSELSCRRCHKVDGNGGGVGPDLSGIGLQKKRDYLLESLVLPNKTIAKGFESVVLALLNGKRYSGIVKSDDGKTLKLMQQTGEIIAIRKEDIDIQAKGKSAMPQDIVKTLSRSDMRDLVEYLSTLRQPPKKP